MKWSKETIGAVANAMWDAVEIDRGFYPDDALTVENPFEVAEAALSAIEQSAEVKALVDAALKASANPASYNTANLLRALKPFTEASDVK
jgi:hypothetical protein